ncbi:hypothetical protein [Lentzea aerocolonigenes]|uniref:hypothetical protein n=1 Tax=Lentzea aerocolonigenes TaxID=68170 RepID=UPI0004C2CCFE|nr:hypothetical protein [Lentzea aerocolonigenes]MCP2247729.1 hypothetical protein [Lentzea aerocolonigenes]
MSEQPRLVQLNNMPVSLVKEGDIIDGRTVLRVNKRWTNQEHQSGTVLDYIVCWTDATPPVIDERTFFTPDTRLTVQRDRGF